MRTRTRCAAFSLLASVALSATGVSTARADGDEAHSVRFNDRAPGLGMTAVGVGLAGRRPGAEPNVPVVQGSLDLTTVPAGSSIVAAYLYWVVYGSVGDDTIEFGTVPSTLTGTLIGTSAHTCWDKFDQTELNRVYRADVTARVAGNANYLIGGFPSGAIDADTQGASLVVVYDDPADSNIGSVVIHDGAITADGGTITNTLDDVVATASTVSAFFRLGTGDGQAALADGTLRFSGTVLGPPPGGHFAGTAGTYWDDKAYDVTALIDPDEPNIPWLRSGGSDCLVFAYAGLTMSSLFVDEDGDGIEDASDNCLGLANADQANSDGDIHGDACDNCDDADNNVQLDDDADGFGNVCDNCFEDANPSQTNSDADSRGDACDNCPNVTNATQTDSDGDGIGDACDGVGEGGGGGATTGGGEGPGTSSGGGDGGAGTTSGGGDGGGTTSGGGDGPASTTSGAGVTSGGGGNGPASASASGSSTTGVGAAVGTGGGEGGGGDGVTADDGCGCGVIGASPDRTPWIALGAVGLALLGLRRRRQG